MKNLESWGVPEQVFVDRKGIRGLVWQVKDVTVTRGWKETLLFVYGTFVAGVWSDTNGGM